MESRRSKIPKRNFAVIDCETDPFKFDRVLYPFAWGYYDGTEYRHWWGRGREREVAEFLGTIGEETIVYAHNGGRFDYHFLSPFFNIDKNPSLFNGRIAKTWIGETELRDSFLILPEPLAAFRKTEIDYDKLERKNRNKYKQEILDYLRDDCLDLYEWIFEFWEEHGPKLTLAQAAVTAWTKIQNVKRPRIPEHIDARIRPYYYGGRCEAWVRGEINCEAYLYDINSAYPAAMLEEHPKGTARFLHKTIPDNPERIRKSFYHFEGKSEGALPVRTKQGLRFPTGKGEFYATGHEILAGLETGRVKIGKVIRAMEFRETDNFRPYVEHYYAARKEAKTEGNRGRELVLKRTLNALYGKFGQDPSDQCLFRFCDWDGYIDEKESGFEEWEKLWGNFDPWWILSKPSPRRASGYLNVAIAASITGMVRAQLLRTMATLSTEPLYCDTDSLVIRERLPQNLVDSNRLGAWDLEAEIKGGYIGGKKLYAFETQQGEWKKASKGVRLDLKDIIDVCLGGVVEWQNEAPTFSVKRAPVYLKRKIRST